MEFRARENFEGRNVLLKDLKIKKNILVACIIRGGKIFFPNGNDCIKANDNVIVVTTLTGLEELNDIID